MKKYYYAFLVMLTIPLAGMSTDIYIPSLPAMTIYFDVHKSMIQYTIMSYVFAMGIGQLFAGPVSDAYGRKKQLIISILLQIFCVLIILNSSNIYWVIIARFFQGIGGAFMVVPLRAILNDVFTGDQLKKQFQYGTIAYALGPIVAPFIGGYLQSYFGWHANFYFILIYAICLLGLFSFTFKETSTTMHALTIDKFSQNYKTLFSSMHFLFGAIFAGILIGYTSLFNVAGPFIIQVALHQSPIVYGHIALLIGLGWFLGNMLNRFIFHINKTIKTKIALSISFITGLMTLILGLEGYFSLIYVVVPTVIIIMSCGSIFSIYVSECLTIFPKIAASANGALFAITWTVYSFFAFIATLLKIHSLFPLGLTYFCLAATCLLIYLALLLPLEKKEG